MIAPEEEAEVIVEHRAIQGAGVTESSSLREIEITSTLIVHSEQ